jgi:assimilatory nitrate reductase catalytic subunit
MDACYFVAPHPRLPDRSWLGGLFAMDRLSTEDRAAILTGRPPTQGPTGPLVCSCFGVDAEAIRACIRGGAGNARDVGAAVKAGTNCGSCIPEIRALIDAHQAALPASNMR